MYEIFALSSITKMCKTINNWFDLQYTIVWIIYYMELKFASWFTFWNFANNFELGLVSMHMWLVNCHDPSITKQFCECPCSNFYTHMKTKKGWKMFSSSSSEIPNSMLFQFGPSRLESLHMQAGFRKIKGENPFLYHFSFIWV